MFYWHRLLIAAAVVVIALVLARVVDKALGRRVMAPEAATRYRVVRRAVTTTIVFVGVLSALLVIPQVRAIAGGILASSAVIGLIIGFAAQRTIGNAIAGLLIAFSQPVRLGDRVIVDDVTGTVEEIGLTYTFIRASDDTRLVIPNEKLASDTIRNLTIRSTENVAEITVQVSLQQDLDRLVEALRAQRRRRVSRRRRAGIVVAALGVLVAVILVTVGFGGAIAYQKGCSLSSLRPFSVGQNTFVYAADGSRLGSIPSGGRNRQKVPWRKISPWMVKATVAVEDRRFWEHGGIDPIGITRAFWADVSQGRVVQGGSTITQQLVRNLYISRERTFTRKLREACLAVKLAQSWSKRRILTAYLKQIYYGRLTYA